MYEQEYAIKVEEYNTFLRELQKYGDNFLNEFMAYIEFHESALQLYKQQTNELYIQLGFATNALYAKEISEKQQYLEQQEHLKKGIEDEQENLRNDIFKEYQRELEIAKTMSELQLRLHALTSTGKKELVAYMQKMNAKSTPIIELLIMNQSERFEILREEEDKFKELKQQYKDAIPIAIEKLQQITDPRIMYDQDYAIKVEEYNTFLRELQKYGDNFLNEFIAYIEFHESAPQLYKQQTNELYTQLGFATNALYAKEIAEKQQYLEQQEHLKKKLKMNKNIYEMIFLKNIKEN